jgi:hypothetical protein
MLRAVIRGIYLQLKLFQNFDNFCHSLSILEKINLFQLEDSFRTIYNVANC